MNPHPTKFITISGKIDPRLSGEFQVVYQTTNEECQVVVNRFEGVFDPREKNDSYKILSDHQGNYSVRLPIDKVQLGGYKRCI